MSDDSNRPEDPDHEEDLDANGHLFEEDVVEVHDDSGDEPMMDEDDDAAYDGEIVIGGPSPGEEEMDHQGELGGVQDNSWEMSGELMTGVLLHAVRRARA